MATGYSFGAFAKDSIVLKFDFKDDGYEGIVQLMQKRHFCLGAGLHKYWTCYVDDTTRTKQEPLNIPLQILLCHLEGIQYNPHGHGCIVFHPKCPAFILQNVSDWFQLYQNGTTNTMLAAKESFHDSKMEDYQFFA